MNEGDACACYGIKNHDSSGTSRQRSEFTWCRYKKY